MNKQIKHFGVNKKNLFQKISLYSLSLFVIISLFLVSVSSVSATTITVPTDYYVIQTGDDAAGNGSSGSPWKTIQHAVDNVPSDSTINVAAGIYVENVLISGKTDLTISGAGQGATIIEPVTGTRSVGVTITNSNTITIKNLKIHTTGPESHGIWVYGAALSGSSMTGLTVQDTTINVDGLASGIIGDSATNAAHSGWLIGGSGHGNTILINNDANDGGDGIDFQDVTNSEVSYNTITIPHPGGSTNVLWTSERFNLANLVFSYNTVSGSGGSEVSILTDFNQNPGEHTVPVESPVFDSSIVGVAFSGNTFSNWGTRAIRVGNAFGSGTVTGIAINSNTFQMTAYTAEVIGGTATDKTGTGNIFNVNSPAKIQTAIDNAFAGDTINVAAGTYTENVNVNKALTLKSTTLHGAIISPSSGTAVNINAVNDTTVDGFEIDGHNTVTIGIGATNSDRTTVKNNYIHNIVDNDAHNAGIGIIYYGWGNAINDALIQGNMVSYTDHNGIWIGAVQPSGTLITSNNNVIQDNIVDHAFQNTVVAPALWGGAIGMDTAKSSSIKGNHISYTGFNQRDIMLINGADSVTIDDNILEHFNGARASIDGWMQSAIEIVPPVNDLTITNNDITVNIESPSAYGWAVWLPDVTGTSSFSNNIITLTGSNSQDVHGLVLNYIPNSDYHGLAGDWTIQGNTFQGGNLGTSSTAIRLYADNPATSHISISGNTINSWTNGIRSSMTNAGNVIVHQNNITSNSAYGLLDDGSTVAIDATNNYWGSVNPTFDSLVSGNVDRTPWYIDSAMTTLNEQVTDCAPSTTESRQCGSSVGICHVGTQERICNSQGAWNDWGTCGGTDYIPAGSEGTGTPCSDNLDNDCDGYTDSFDSGCSVTPDYYTKTESDNQFATLTAIAGFITETTADAKYVIQADFNNLFNTQFGTKTTNDLAEGTTNKYFTDSRVRAAVSATAPLTYNSGTGAFGISQSSATIDGYLSSTDWNLFNAKQSALGFTPENSANKEVANGYAGLDSSGVVPAGQLPPITNEMIANNAVTQSKLAQNSVGPSEIQSNAVGSDEIAASAVTDAKISDVAASKITGLTKSQVGLGNVDNTADTAKPVSTAQQTALDLKANLNSPILVTPTLGDAKATSLSTTTSDGQLQVQPTASSNGRVRLFRDTLGNPMLNIWGYDSTDHTQKYLTLYVADAPAFTESGGTARAIITAGDTEVGGRTALELQSPSQVRITAVDTTYSLGNVRIAADQYIRFHPRTEPEADSAKYLTLDTAGQVQGADVELSTNSGNLVLAPAGVVEVNSGLTVIGDLTLPVGSIGNADIAAGAISNDKVANNAAIAESKLSLDYSTAALNTAITDEGSRATDKENDLENRAVHNMDGVDIYLAQGWNDFKLPWFVLVGTNQTSPLDLSGNYSVANVLAGVGGKYTYLAYYDGSVWQTYSPTDESSTTFTEFPTAATSKDYEFHIYMSEGARLTIGVTE